MYSYAILAFLLVILQNTSAQNELIEPVVTIEPLHPKGFKVSIPDQEGIELFAFHGNLNVEFDGHESGMISRDITKPKNGKWTFVDRSVRLRDGNTIYYWIDVVFNDGTRSRGNIYDGSYTIQSDHFLQDKNPDTEQFMIPDILIEPLNPKGLRASIPHVEGIKLFSFHLNINEPMNGKDAGQYSKDIIKQKGDRWTFLDKSIKLKKGDKLYYWYYVLHTHNNVDNLGYEKLDRVFKVVNLIFDDPATTTTTTQKPTTVKTAKTTTLKPGCEATPTKINGGKSTCKGKLLFEDNFGKINENRWQTEIRFADAPDFEFNSYTDNPSILYTQKNFLYIKPKPAEAVYGGQYVNSPEEVDLGLNCTGQPESLECVQKAQAFLILPPVVSGRINTSPHLSFKYGIVEIRAKLPKGDWLYPELLLRPKSYEYGPGYQSGEIKIAFMPGNKNMSSKLYGGLAFGDNPKARAYGLKFITAHDKPWNDDFHVYSVKWSPDGIKMFVDDEIYGNCPPPEGGFASLQGELGLEGIKLWKQGTNFAPFDQEMVLVLGVGAGGHMFADGDGKPWVNNDPKAQRKFYSVQNDWRNTWSDDSALVVDSVKIYAL